MAAQESPAKRWCFTINNPTERDRFWENPDNMEQVEYLIVQEERGEEGTVHYQGFMIMKTKKRMTWLKRNMNERAHWEKTRGTDKQAAAYCKKDDTHVPGGLRFESGCLPKDKKDKEKEAAELLEEIKRNYKRPADIPADLLMEQNFVSAYKLLTADVLGPYRPNLKIITLVGPPGCGKSYLINNLFPQCARLIMGNAGHWWQNPCNKVGVIEEFAGQIPLQKMLNMLDPYPQSLEVKGGTRPCLFEVIFITSNSCPEDWYKSKNPAVPEEPKRQDALLALYDRLGYHPAWHHGALQRTCGHYLEPPQIGAITPEWILESRRWLMKEVRRILEMPDEQQEPAQAAAAAAAAAEPDTQPTQPIEEAEEFPEHQPEDALDSLLDDDFEPNIPRPHALRRQNASWDRVDLF